MDWKKGLGSPRVDEYLGHTFGLITLLEIILSGLLHAGPPETLSESPMR